MAEMIPITLAKALKLKNRLAGRVAKLTADVTAFNSVQAGAERLDVRSKYDERTALVRRLVDLKLAIHQANAPIQRSIFELAELKADIALFGALNTKHGTFQEGYPTAGQVTYAAEFRKVEVDRFVEEAEKRIDAAQDRLDAFNNTTLIGVERETLELGDSK